MWLSTLLSFSVMYNVSEREILRLEVWLGKLNRSDHERNN